MVAMVHWCQQQAEQLFVVKGTVDWCVSALPIGVPTGCLGYRAGEFAPDISMDEEAHHCG